MLLILVGIAAIIAILIVFKPFHTAPDACQEAFNDYCKIMEAIESAPTPSTLYEFNDIIDGFEDQWKRCMSREFLQDLTEEMHKTVNQRIYQLKNAK